MGTDLLVVAQAEELCAKHGWMADEALLSSMQEANAAELEKLKAALTDAEENQGEMEVLDGLFAIAAFHARIGGKADAYAAFEEVGLDNEEAVREVGRRFRSTVLAMGGGAHPSEVFRAFRGRDPSPEALLRHSGLGGEDA